MRKLLLASSLLLGLAAAGCSNPNTRSGTDYDTGSNSGYGNEYGRRNVPSGGETDNRSENTGALPDTTPATPSAPSSTMPSTPPEQ